MKRLLPTSTKVKRPATPLLAREATATATAFDDEDVEESPTFTTPPEDLRRQRGMAMALFFTYFSVMGAKCALPSVLAQLTNPQIGLSYDGYGNATPQQLMSKLLALSTVAVAVGKLILGPLIDRFGGTRSLQVCLSVLAALLLVISSCSTFTSFMGCWILVDFIFSSCWAACINAVHQSFPKRQWAPRVGMLAAAARTGNASAFTIFALVLQLSVGRMRQPWRFVYAASSLLQILPLTLLFMYGGKPKVMASNKKRDKGEEDEEEQLKKPSIRESLATVRREARTPEFWCHLINRSALMVFGSFLLFVPTLMEQCYGVTSSEAAQIGSIFAIGCLIAVTGGSQTYAKLGRLARATTALGLMGTSTLCTLAHLYHVHGVITMTASQATLALFLWGLTFAVPFYIPCSLYALKRGGRECSATIADVFDFVGFGLLAVFNGYVASIKHSVPPAWIPTFQFLSLCAFSSMISLALAALLE